MALIVQKFGGTSVGNIERIKNVAQKVKREFDKGNKVVVVVSAMSGETNKLVGFCEQVSSLITSESLREYDMIVSSGEYVTAGLLALELQSIGIPAKSMLAWQIPIITESEFSKARIAHIESKRLLNELENKVIVVPGFQGVTAEDDVLSRNMTTLGRGGSDTSAVAIAAALNAERCDIFTDVDGVYTSDPRIVPKARKLRKIGYEEVLEMASLGAKVLHSRCVELAMKYKVKTQVLSSFEDVEGTFLVEEEEVVERRLITGVTYSKSDAQVTLQEVENTPGIAAKIFGPLADAGINVDMIVQNVGKEDKTADVTFTVAKTDLARAEEYLNKAGIKFAKFYKNTNVVKVSVIGVGMRSHAGIAQKMFETLASKGINIHVISTSEIKISVLIDEEYLELAMRALHTAYGLDG
jgi:aspartate kinase